MPRIPVLVLSVMLGAACAWLVSCGGSRDTAHLLPGTTATALIDNLTSVQSQADEGNCATAADEAGIGLAKVEALPGTVDSDLKNALQEGYKRLAALAQDPAKCS